MRAQNQQPAASCLGRRTSCSRCSRRLALRRNRVSTPDANVPSRNALIRTCAAHRFCALLPRRKNLPAGGARFFREHRLHGGVRGTEGCGYHSRLAALRRSAICEQEDMCAHLPVTTQTSRQVAHVSSASIDCTEVFVAPKDVDTTAVSLRSGGRLSASRKTRAPTCRSTTYLRAGRHVRPPAGR